ncbi:thioredoxin [Sporodiniella umbellata]|nr:thioredoxin [Sporodiniella umbellata]
MPGFTIPKSLADLNEILSSNEFVLVDFTATWCGPCKMITPVLEKHSAAYSNVVFVKVDVDDLSEIASHYEVRAMPTIVFFKNGNKVDEIVGANPGAIAAKLTESYGNPQ